MLNRTPRRKRLPLPPVPPFSPYVTVEYPLLTALEAMKGHGLFLPAIRDSRGDWWSSPLVCLSQQLEDGSTTINFWHMRKPQRWSVQNLPEPWLGCVVLVKGKVATRAFATDYISETP